MIARLLADLPHQIETHGFVFQLKIKYGMKQMYPIYKDVDNQLFVGYFLTALTTKSKKKQAIFKACGVWQCPRLAEKQRIHELTDCLLAIPIQDVDDDTELQKTLQCLARTIVGTVNDDVKKEVYDFYKVNRSQQLIEAVIF